MNEPVIGD